MPLPYLAYEITSLQDFKNERDQKKRIKLLEILAKVSVILQENAGNTAYLKAGKGGGLLYDNYTGVNSKLGHFRCNDGYRVTCQQKNGILHLRHYGTHDFTERNP